MNNRLLSLGLLLISAAYTATTNAQAAFTFEPTNAAQLKRTEQEYVVSNYYPQEHAKGNSKIDLAFAVTEWGTGTGSERQSMPTIVKRDENGWQMVKFNNDLFKHQYWVGVYDMPDQPYLWGFTDNSMEGPAHEVEVVFSQDNGNSWTHISTLEKPWYMAFFDGFRMNKKGEGEAIISIDCSSSPDQKKVGRYVYKTKDWGKTWATPVFSRNALEKAVQPSERPTVNFDQQP